MWKYLKASSKEAFVPALRLDVGFAVSPLEKAEALNGSFVKNFAGGPRVQTFNDPIDNVPRLTLVELEEVLRRTPARKATGEHPISSRSLHIAKDQLKIPLLHLFNQVLTTGKVPARWKTAHVVPVKKKGDASLVENYRPISLLCLESKIFERILYERLLIEVGSSIPKVQYGFRRNHSCVQALALATQGINDVICSHGTIDGIFLDASKAFDRVPHRKLVDKLTKLGVSEYMVRIIGDYLSDREQLTIVDGARSSSVPVTSGVPQGSILGPLLFVLYTSDVWESLSAGTSIYQFADDVFIFRRIEGGEDHDILQSDLDEISAKCEDLGLPFNDQKTVLMRFSHKRKPDTSGYKLNGNTLLPASRCKWLGFTMDPKLMFSDHTKCVVRKCVVRCILLNRRFKGALRSKVQRVFKSFVLSPMLYGLPVYFRETADQSKRLLKPFQLLQRLQKDDAPIEEYVEKLKLTLPLDMYKRDLLQLTFKFATDAISGGGDLFKVKSVGGTRTRSVAKLSNHPRVLETVVKFSATVIKALLRSFAHRASEQWNSLPSTTYNSISTQDLEEFKKSL